MEFDWRNLTNPVWYLYWYEAAGVVGTIVAGALVLLVSKWACEAWAVAVGHRRF